MAIQFARTGRTGSMNDTAIDMGRYAHARAMLSFIDLLYPDTLLVVAEKGKKERMVCFFSQKHHFESEYFIPPAARVRLLLITFRNQIQTLWERFGGSTSSTTHAQEWHS